MTSVPKINVRNSVSECAQSLRKENAGNYTPKNCVWETRKIQAENTRRNLIVRGKPLSVVVGNTGTAYDRVRMRLRRGWTEDRALGGVL